MPLTHLDAFDRHPLVFLTVCTAKRAVVLHSGEVHLILQKIWRDSLDHNGWCVGRYVIMPDHIHLFAMPAGQSTSLHQWISIWKSISAGQITARTSAKAPLWQRDYFDRYLRTSEAYGDKWDYVCNNPVRAKLVAKWQDWPYQGVIHELKH